MNDDFYMSLDEARSELHRRWNDTELRNRVETALGVRLIPQLRLGPRVYVFRQLISPDNGFMSFYYRAAYLGALPFVTEFHGDRFTWLNEEKRGLAQLRVSIGAERFHACLFEMHPWENKSLEEIVMTGGEKLIDFHHRLFEIESIRAETEDMTGWYRDIGKPADYYYFLFAHCIAHSVLFETFLDEDEPGDRRRRKGEQWFTDNVIRPNFERVEREFGMRPMIVRAYPPGQTDDEDFFWWSYPPRINDYIVEYARRNGLELKPVR